MEQKVVQKAPEQAKKSKPNMTGIPTQMKLDFERRSGLSFDDVRVHYNSDKPRKIGALAYTQIPQVHIGPGQERHLRHELGHVVQQKRGIVRPNLYFKGFSINDSLDLERDADCVSEGASPCAIMSNGSYSNTVQRKQDYGRIANRDIVLGVLQVLTPGITDIESSPLVINPDFDDLLFFNGARITTCSSILNDVSLSPLFQVIYCDNYWIAELRKQGITDLSDIIRIENAIENRVSFEYSPLRTYRRLIEIDSDHPERNASRIVYYKEKFSSLIAHFETLSGAGAYDFRIQAILYNSNSIQLYQYPDMAHDLQQVNNQGQSRNVYDLLLANMLQHEIGHRRQHTVLDRDFLLAQANYGVRILAEYENILLHENSPYSSWRFRTYYTYPEDRSDTHAADRSNGTYVNSPIYHKYLDNILRNCDVRLLRADVAEFHKIERFLTNLSLELRGVVPASIHNAIAAYISARKANNIQLM